MGGRRASCTLPAGGVSFLALRVWEGKKCHGVNADHGWTVQELKEALALDIAPPSREQRLYVDDRELREPEATLRELGDSLPGGVLEDVVLRRKTREQADWLDSVRESPMHFNHTAPDDVRADRDTVLAAVKGNGLALGFASKELKGDREIVLLAVHHNGCAINHAAKRHKSDKEIVLIAVQQQGKALQYVGDDLRGDREVVLCAVRIDGWALHFATEALQADKEVVLIAVRQRGRALCYASEFLRRDLEVVLAAVNQEGLALEYAEGDLRKNGDAALAALRQNHDALRFVEGPLRTHKLLLRIATGRPVSETGPPDIVRWGELCAWHERNPGDSFTPNCFDYGHAFIDPTGQASRPVQCRQPFV